MLCVLIRIIEAILMSTLNIQLLRRKSKKKNTLNYRYLLPDLVPWLTLSGSNYPYLEQISMVPKMFEPLKFDCTCIRLLKCYHVIWPITIYKIPYFIERFLIGGNEWASRPAFSYNWTTMARTSSGSWKFVLGMGSSSYWGLIIAQGQEANGII